MKTCVAAGAVLVLLAGTTGCRPSASSLENAVEDKPGVLTVEVVDNGGEADLPFAELPWVVTVTMVASPSRAQVRDVVEEYRDDIKSGDVESLSILAGKPLVSELSFGVGTGPQFERWIGAFAEGLTNPETLSITVDPTVWDDYNGSSIDLMIAPDDFASWYSTVRRYDTQYELADLDVRSSRFSYSASGNHSAADPPRARAQLRAARLVHRRFGLVGAKVWGTGSSRLVVAPGTDLSAARAYTKQISSRATGRIEVVDDDHVDLSELRGADLEFAELALTSTRHQTPYFSWARARGRELLVGTPDLGSSTYLGFSGEYAGEQRMAVRFVLPGGSSFSAATPWCLPEELDVQREWKRYAATTRGDRTTIRLLAHSGASVRSVGHALSRLCDGSRITVAWPDGRSATVEIDRTSERPRVTSGTGDLVVLRGIRQGWGAAGSES